MLTKIRTISGGGRDLRLFILFTVASSVIQAGAVIVLYPLLDDLFGGAPADAWPWVLLMVALIAGAWGIDILAAHKGLAVGLSLMHSIQRHAPGAVLSWPTPVITTAKAARLRSLLATGANEVTSAPVLLVGPLVTAVVFTFALGVGLAFFTVPAALVTVAGGVLMMLALLASSRMVTRADEEFTAANENLDDRLTDYARAQPSLRTARQVSAGARLVDDALVDARGRSLRLLFWQVPGEILFSLVLQAVLIGYGLTVWLAFDAGTLGAVSAAVTVIVMLRVVEQVTGVSRLAVGLRSLDRTLTEAVEVVTAPDVVPAHPAPVAPHIG
ncbi:MAG: ABC transporter ATP-binding protein, partial [Corynebacterium sp.]|nr:ABC transporter ATP-binding protein [Corynebacterium sp.]